MKSIRAGLHEGTVAQKTKKEEAPKLTLEKVIEDFNSSWEYTSSNYHQKWENAFSLYNNVRVKVGYNGITNTFVPMTFSTVETIVAALFGAKPKFEFEPPSDSPDQNTEILNSLLDYFWDKDKWNIKVIKWGRGMVREGTAAIYLYWDVDHPVMVNVPIRDFFIDPTATDMENAQFMGRRYLTTLDQLKKFQVVDPETGEMKPKYKNLDKVKETNTSGDQTDKQKKDMFYGSVVGSEDTNQVEVIEYWTKDRVFSVANRSIDIEDNENYFKAKARQNGEKFPTGIVPFASLRDYTDESLFYAKGEVEIIADEQELLNDLTNQNQDSIIYSLNQMYTLDPKYAHLLKQIENLPGAVYLAEPNALQPIQQRPIPQDAFNERLNLKNEMRETTASNEVVKGVSQDQKTTATEVNAQIAGAGQRLALKITQIENEGFHQLAKIVFGMIKCYVTEPMMVKIMGKDGIRWEEFNPKDFQGDYEPRVQLETSVQSHKQEEANMAKELLGAFLNDPEINQAELKKMVLSKAFDLDPDEVDRLVQPDPMQGMDPSMMGMDPSMQPPAPETPPAPEDTFQPTHSQEPTTEAAIDPMTGEVMPVGDNPQPPSDQEIQAMIDAGLI